jgi:hypothetical protein
MYRTNILPVLASAAIGCVALTAQQQLTLPLHADVVDGHHSLGQPFGTPGFRTQILVDGIAIAPTGAVLNSIAFRTDRPSAPLAPQQIQNVTVELSHTSAFVTGMSNQFSMNVTGATTVVFQGTVNLPGSSVGFAGPQPWDIVINFTTPFSYFNGLGNLLIDIKGNNPAGGFPNHFLDAVQGGGAATQFGTSGDNPTFDTLRLGAFTNGGNSTEARRYAPGHPIDFTSMLSFTQPPGVVALGIAPQPLPIDLGLIGAPTNFLYIDPIVLAPHAWTGSFIGYYSAYTLLVPGVPSLVGVTLYGQSAILEPSANALGLVLSNAVEVRVGDQFEQLPLQQLDAADPTAPTGTLVDFSFSPAPDYGSVPIRLDGIFF